MKLLLAVLPSESKIARKKTIAWACRSGFKLKIFMPKGADKNEYLSMIDDINYQEFTDLTYYALSASQNPVKYAQQNGFDLLAVIPAYLDAWNDSQPDSLMVIEFQKDMASARKRMSDDPKLHEVKFDNGTRVVRV